MLIAETRRTLIYNLYPKKNTAVVEISEVPFFSTQSFSDFNVSTHSHSHLLIRYQLLMTIKGERGRTNVLSDMVTIHVLCLIYLR